MRNWWSMAAGSLLCLLGALCWIGGSALKTWEYTPSEGKGAVVAVEIPQGATLRKAIDLLADSQIIKQPTLFYHWARWVMGAGGAIKWGQLAFKDDMAPRDVLRVLRTASPVIHRLNIPPGLRLEQIEALIQDANLAIRGNFLQKSKDEKFLKTLGIEASSMEGYLAPGSYGLARHLDVEILLKIMVMRRYANWDTKLRQRARALRTDMHQVLTMASIIEAETTTDDEREKIASVLYNRMINNWKLCSDATIAYAKMTSEGPFDGVVDKDDRMTDSPYNTCIHRGLPPGPICAPSEQSIHAALWPKRTAFMYFVPIPGQKKGHRFCPDLLCALGRGNYHRR